MKKAMVHCRIDSSNPDGHKIEYWMSKEQITPLGGWRIGASMARVISKMAIYDMSRKKRYVVDVKVDQETRTVTFDHSTGELVPTETFLGKLYPNGIQYNRLYTTLDEQERYKL